MDEELRELWAQCSEPAATEADWKKLYQLVVRILSRCHAPELAGLYDDRRTYIDQYFNDRVFFQIRRDVHGPYHAGALVEFFRRYLRDCLDGQIAGPAGPANPDAEPEIADPETPEESDERYGEMNLPNFISAECETTVEAVGSAARKFLDEQEEWVRLMLRFGYCPDADAKIPLIRLAQMHKIPSHHYRASQLGINHRWEKGIDHFRGTILGRWLVSTLPGGIQEDRSDCVLAALEILCFEALKS